MSNDSPCEGCLSTNRRLKTADEECKKVFYSFIDKNYRNDILQLCWECQALMAKIMSFRQQVQRAHQVLLSCLQTRLRQKCLSNLTKELCNDTIYMYHDDNDDENYTDELPIVVKVEEGADHNYDDTEVADDGMCDDDLNKCIVVGTDLKIDVKIEPMEKESKSSKKRKKIIQSKDDFNDSDEEPLRGSAKTEQTSSAKEEKRKGKKKKRHKEKKDSVRKRSVEKEGARQARVRKRLQVLGVDGEMIEMVELSWEQVEEERQKALQSETYLRHRYRCERCAVGFNHRCKLEDHERKHDPAIGADVCHVCSVRCRDARALAAHKRRHRVRWRCRECGGAWSRAAVCADHAARAHGAASPTHACSVCGHTESTLGKLRKHLKVHAEKQQCPQCAKVFSDRASLRTHLFIHRGEKEYACDVCEKRFLLASALRTHLVTHQASARLYCHRCDMNFKNFMSYNQHMKYSLKHVDPAKLKHACNLCDKKFLKAKRLEEHNTAVHLKLTPISCTVPGCNFSCSSRPVLRTHTRMLHRGRRAVRDHVCHVCGRAYTTKKSLEGHLRAHSGERPSRRLRTEQSRPELKNTDVLPSWGL